MNSFARILTASAILLGCFATPAVAQSSEPLANTLNNGRVSYERVGEVLVNAMVCQPFGYSVDHTGLILWAEEQVSALADQTDGYDRDDALLRVNRAATDHYWFVRNRYGGVFELTNQSTFYGPRRFTSRFRVKCADLDRSSDAGALFTKIAREPRRLELLGQVRSIMLSDETARLFARAYAPYLAKSLGSR